MRCDAEHEEKGRGAKMGEEFLPDSRNLEVPDRSFCSIVCPP